MAERFFSAQPIVGDRVVLEGDEAHHLAHVCRLARGGRAVLFDGHGAEFEAEVVAVGRRSVELRVLARREVDRELRFAITVASAVPKGERLRFLVEKLTELGAARFVPLATTRSVVHPRETKLETLRRAVIEACKQCGRNRLMQIDPLIAWAELCAQEPRTAGGETGPAERRLLCSATGAPIAHQAAAGKGPVTIAIGPEGGFTDEELSLAAAHGWQAVSLGPRTLRVETAAIAACAYLAAAAEG